jgi:hypothetical protein
MRAGPSTPPQNAPALVRGVLVPKLSLVSPSTALNTFPVQVFYGGPTVMSAAKAMLPYLTPWAWGQGKDLRLETVPITPNGLAGLKWPRTDFHWWWAYEKQPEPRYRLSSSDNVNYRWAMATPADSHGSWVAGTSSLLAFPGLKKHTPEFIQALIEVAERLKVDPNHLATIMQIESGIDSKKPNIIKGKIVAFGLIQFTPSTATILKTSIPALKAMTPIEQLEYVYKYYKPYAGRLKSAGRLYMATFYPKLLFAPADRVIARKGQKVYDWNKSLDVNKDGILTVGDVMLKAENAYRRYAKLPPLQVETLTPVSVPEKGASKALPIVVLGLLGAGTYFGWRALRKSR